MHDHDDIDFGMLDLPTRPGPAKVSAAPEMDPVEAQHERDVVSAPYRECRAKREQRMLKPAAALRSSMERNRAAIEFGEKVHRHLGSQGGNRGGRPDAIVNGIPVDFKTVALDSVSSHYLAHLPERQRFTSAPEVTDDEIRGRFATVRPTAIEVKHGSGKVKV